MSETSQYLWTFIAFLLMYFYMKPYPLRKWLGITLFIVGVVATLKLPRGINGFDTGILSSSAASIGLGLFWSRRKYEDEE